MNKIMLGVTMVSAVLLHGCASSKPSCSVGSGLGCQSVMDVNTAINQGYGEALSSSPNAQKLKLAPMDTFEDIPARTDEQWVKVWVAPYVDKNNNYHVAHTYYTVIKPAQWKESAGE